MCSVQHHHLTTTIAHAKNPAQNTSLSEVDATKPSAPSASRILVNTKSCCSLFITDHFRPLISATTTYCTSSSSLVT